VHNLPTNQPCLYAEDDPISVGHQEALAGDWSPLLAALQSLTITQRDCLDNQKKLYKYK
jgi:hypothetical protein